MTRHDWLIVTSWVLIFSSGPFPWQPAQEWSIEEYAPGLYRYVWREVL